MPRPFRLASAALLVAHLAAPPTTAPAASDPGAHQLSPRHRAWLEEVAALASEEERAAFLALAHDYQREAFIARFWEVRDPYPQTGRNEFRELWESRLELARERFPALSGDRARMFLLFGPPRLILPASCGEILRPLELWLYDGAERIRGSFALVFYRGAGGADGWRLWSPREGLFHLLAGAWRDAAGETEADLLRRIPRDCAQGGDIAGALGTALDWQAALARGVGPPDPGAEWVRSFIARSTELPPNAAPLPAELSLSFPGRHQSRTVVQGVVRIPRDAVAASPGGGSAHSFVLDGEVLRGGDLFESFRYRFDLPPSEGDTGAGSIPLVVERYLRPGPYTLVLKVEDRNGGRFYRVERELEVPRVDPAPATALARADGDGGPPAGPGQHPREDGGDGADEGDGAAAADGAGGQALAEANASLAAGDWTVKILPPARELHTGRLRVEAAARGEGIAKLSFVLDGRPVMSKSRPPYSVELDLGRAPRTHALQALAVDAAGGVLARDEIVINAGPHRFGIRLVEPRRGGRYARSLRAHAEVDVPAGDALDRVEFYLDEELLASVYQPPFVQPLLLPEDREVGYVRAVAYLADGNSAEDVVFVNAPDLLDEVRVDFVELYTTVLDRQGRPVEALAREDFVVLEDGAEQQLRRFERVRDLPIHAGILVDTSTSMLEELREAERAALQFFERVLTPKDRAAVITFADRPQLAVPFTSDPEVLAGGLAGIAAEGETALWDSLVYALYYFSGIRGKRALILLTDGEDSHSRYGFDEALEYARRTGVAIYPIGLTLSNRSFEVRARLERLAGETGGRCSFVQSARSLAPIYAAIEEELRSQYLLAYQSSGQGEDFRAVEVEVRRPGMEAKTIRGYYP